MLGDIDVNKTVANAKEKLKQFKRLHRISGSNEYLKLKDGKIELVESCGEFEQCKIAFDKKKEIVEAINKLSNIDYISMLYIRYIAKERHKFVYYMQKWGYSNQEFYDMYERALIEFSEVYRGGELLVFVNNNLLQFLNNF